VYSVYSLSSSLARPALRR